MSPEIMGPQMDSYYLACLSHNSSGCRIGYRENLVIRPNPSGIDVSLETVGNFLWNKDNFPFLSAFRSSERELSVLDVIGCQFQDLADPHPAPGHQLKNEPIPGFNGTENDFIHHFLFENGPADGSRWSIQLFQHRGIAWASEIGVKILGDEVEKGSELGVPGAFG